MVEACIHLKFSMLQMIPFVYFDVKDSQVYASDTPNFRRQWQPLKKFALFCLLFLFLCRAKFLFRRIIRKGSSSQEMLVFL